MTERDAIPGAGDEAISLLLNRIASDPDNPEGYLALGSLFEMREECEKACASYRKSLELNPGDYRAFHNIARCRWRLKKYDEAIEFFTKSMALQDADPAPFFNLVLMLEDIGRSEDMAGVVLANRKMLRVHPGFPELKGIFAQLETDFLPFCRKIFRIEGWLRGLEGYTLMMLAAEGRGTGGIVEIGSWMGRSTYCLAMGSRRKNRERVTAIDHFHGSPENQEQPVLRQEGTTYHRFWKNMVEMEVSDHVTPIVAGSEVAVEGWHQPVRLLFIDGDHSYEASKRDFECWSPHVTRDGYIVFHDIDASDGVSTFYRELMNSSPDYVEVLAVLSLRVIGRRIPAAPSPR
jgi:MMP 1-O-methyltransferase